ncbi:hypothetical protein BC832DRAFT_614901 [Gaertneriomyces semiglobifer]|nr:hypothetical protein BC832DRAFT_614901 [Gaertneriomyces semiglobifer]
MSGLMSRVAVMSSTVTGTLLEHTYGLVSALPDALQAKMICLGLPHFQFPHYKHNSPPPLLVSASQLVLRWLSFPEPQSHLVHCLRQGYSEEPPTVNERRKLLHILFHELPHIYVLAPTEVTIHARHTRAIIAINAELVHSLLSQLEAQPEQFLIAEFLLAAVILHELAQHLSTHYSPGSDDNSGELIEKLFFGYKLRHRGLIEPLSVLAADDSDELWIVRPASILRQLEQDFPTPWTPDDMEATESRSTFGLGQLNGTDTLPASPATQSLPPAHDQPFDTPSHYTCEICQCRQSGAVIQSLVRNQHPLLGFSTLWIGRVHLRRILVYPIPQQSFKRRPVRLVPSIRISALALNRKRKSRLPGSLRQAMPTVSFKLHDARGVRWLGCTGHDYIGSDVVFYKDGYPKEGCAAICDEYPECQVYNAVSPVLGGEWAKEDVFRSPPTMGRTKSFDSSQSALGGVPGSVWQSDAPVVEATLVFVTGAFIGVGCTALSRWSAGDGSTLGPRWFKGFLVLRKKILNKWYLTCGELHQ